jgi:hypothetical protein
VVSEVKKASEIVFLCELCGFGYRDLETAERCEQYCYTHSRTSVALARKAVHKPQRQVVPTDRPLRQRSHVKSAYLGCGLIEH